ncbi:FYVE and coiled-coil domain-containing protein 1-like [Glandiceps talaboti]
MAKAQSPKIIQDIKDCIRDLKQDFKDNQIPINDDSTTLQRFCAKLEYLLKTERKDKTSLLGAKKDYWNYFYECLYKVKGLNDGVRFVKSLPEFRTSLGKGRALIRYSLVHQRLADTLQQCVTNGKVTSDWYKPMSILLNHNLSSLLINDLYDLNDIQFDLAPTGYDLDNAWPTFARKSFGGAGYGSWRPPSRSSSISSLTSLTSQPNDSFAPGSPHFGLKPSIDEEKHSALQIELDQSEITIQQLQQETEQLQTEKEEMKKLALDTETRLSDATSQLQRKIQDLEYQVSKATKELEEKKQLWDEERGSLKNRVEESEAMNTDLYTRIDALHTQHESREKVFADLEEELKQKLQNSETSNAELKIEIKGLAKDLELKDTGEKRKDEQLKELEIKLQAAEGKQVDLLSKMEGMVDEKDNKASDHFDSANKVHELLNKMSETEKYNIKLKGQNDELNRQVQSLQNELEENQRTSRNKFDDMQQQVEQKEGLLEQTEEAWKNKLTASEKLQDDLRIENQSLIEKFENIQATVRVKDEELSNLEQVSSKLEEEKLSQQLQLQQSLNKAEAMQEELRSKLSNISIEHESKESQYALNCDKLRTKVTELEERNNALSNTCEELKQEVRDSKIEKSELQMRYDDTDSSNSQMKSVVDELQADINSKCKENDVIKSELEEVRDLVNRIHGDDAECSLQQFSDKVHSDNKPILQKLLSIVESRQDLQAKVRVLDGRMIEKENEITGLEQICDEHQHEVQDSKIQLADLKTYISKLENEQVASQSTIENKTKELEELQRKCQCLENKHLEYEKSSKELEEIVEAKDNKITEMAKNNEDLETSLKEVSEERDELKKENDQLKENMAKHEEEMAEKLIAKDAELVELMLREEKLQNDLKKETEMKEKEKQELIDKVKVAELNAARFQEEAKMSSEEKSSLDEKIKTLEETLEQEKLNGQHLQGTLDDFRKIHEENASQEEVFEERKQQISKEYEDKVNFLKQQFTSIEDSLQTQVVAKANELDDLKDQFDLLLKEKNEVKDKNDELNVKISEMDEQCEQIITERTDLQEKLEQSSAEAANKITEITEETDELVKNLNSITLERDDLQRQITALQKSVGENDEILKSKDEKLQTLQEEFRNVKATMETELSALRFQLSSETMQYQQQINTYADQAIEMISLRDKNAENEQLLASLGDELHQTTKAWEQERSKLKSELEKVSVILSAKKEECKSLHVTIDQLNTRLEDEKSAVKKEKVELSKIQKQLNKFEKAKDVEMKQINSDNEELKKRLIKLIRDKDNLWQKTDWLAHQQKLQAAERWLDDKEVSHCMQCNSEFSIILRRHHCRLCGKIFCHSCSNNWIMTKHSSKKARACLVCYAKHQHQLEEGGMDTSVVDNSDEDIDPALIKGSLRHRLSSSESSTVTSPDEENGRSDSRISFVTASSGVLSPMSDDLKEFPSDQGISTTERLCTSESSNTENADQPDSSSLLEEGRKVNPAASVVMTTGEDGVGLETTDEADTSKEELDTTKDEVFDMIGDEEIAISKEESEKWNTLGKSMVTNEDSLTSSLTMSAEQLENPSNDDNEEWIKAGKSYAVPVLVEKPGIVLCWEFTTEPKNIGFSVAYKDNEEMKLEDSQVLIPLCKCNSHRQAVQGELMAKQPGVYTLIFDNSYSRFTSKKVKYKLQVKQPEALD